MWERERAFLAALGRDLSILNPYFGRATHDIHGAKDLGSTAAGFPDVLMFKYVPESMMESPYISYTPLADQSTLLRSGTVLPKTKAAAKSTLKEDVTSLPKVMKKMTLETVHQGEGKLDSTTHSSSVRHTMQKGTITEPIMQESKVKTSKSDNTGTFAPITTEPEGKASQDYLKEKYVKVQAMCGETKTYWSYEDKTYENVVRGKVAPGGHCDSDSTADSAELLKQVSLSYPSCIQPHYMAHTIQPR